MDPTSAIQAPLAVQLRFVRAAPQSVTLDFVVTSGKEAIERFELQYRLLAEAGDEPTKSDDIDEDTHATWTTASSSLKSARCTKSALKPGAAYVRAIITKYRTPCSVLLPSKSIPTGRSLTLCSAQAFRVRACAYPETWGPFGASTPPIRTLLPELPADCSESEGEPTHELAS